MIEIKEGTNVHYTIRETCEHKLTIPLILNNETTRELKRAYRCWVCGAMFESIPTNSLVLGTDGVSIP